MATALLDDRLAPLSLADTAAFAAALGASFERTGFAIVADHGIPGDVIARAEAAMRALFALPEAVKRRHHVVGGGGARGYTPFGIEVARDAATVDRKEFWHVGRERAAASRAMPANVWPAELPGFRAAMLDLYAAFEATGLRLLAAIADHLGIARERLADAVDGGNSVLRLLHYPPVPAGAAGMRAAPHEDIDVITLLLGAQEAGLELRLPDGRWRAVSPPAGALVVNVGDMLARLTGGGLRSTTHRVADPPRERAAHARYAMPFFLHFRPDFLIEAPGTEPIMADDFLQERLRAIGLL